MASAVCQNQFLGSRISLISKSEIRYEGILYALDLCEATISLAKVRSFGTEDRPTDRPIPSKDDVFEYIIFRGADIKSIDVVEPPKQAANTGASGIPADPAIVDFSHANGGGSGGPGYGGIYEGGRQRPNNRRGGGSPMYMGPPNNGGGGPRRRSGGFQNEPGMGNGRHTPNRNQMGGGGGGGPGGRPQYGPPGGYRMNYGGNFRQGGNYMNNGGGGGGPYQQRNGRMTTPNRGGNFGQPQGRRGGRPQGNMGMGGGGRPQFRTRGMNRASFPPKVSFDADFDFEKANEELLTTLAQVKLEDDSETSKEGDEAQKEDQESKEQRIFYKKDDFFDNISCEALERSKGNVPRVDWKAERKLNAETFGLPNNTSNNGPNNRPNRRGGNGPRMPRGGNMFYGSPMGPIWMSPNHFYRPGNMNMSMNRRPRNKNN